MERRHPLIEDNVSLLRQGIELIERVGDALYANARPPCMESGVGGHFRHCIDFYNRFLSSFSTGRINYLLRPRNPLVETSRRLAVAEVEAIIEKLRRLSPGDLQSDVQVIAEDFSGPLDAMAWSRSSVMRELQSLLGHTVHHYAMIALALRLQGFEPAAEFGVAPSTLAYWRRTA
ncbi:MAG TPA: hypothetical protein VJZ91_02760 [Blastocatellia bacterium]|nr:hypothetical protein [Blastocatellia bacterium]